MIIIIMSSDYNNFPHSHILYILFGYFYLLLLHRLTEFMPKKREDIISTNTAHISS